MSTKVEYLQRFTERPVAILCHDDSRITGIISSVVAENTSLLLRKATIFERGSKEKSSSFLLSISQIKNMFCLSSVDRLDCLPELKDFPKSEDKNGSKKLHETPGTKVSYEGNEVMDLLSAALSSSTKEPEYFDYGVSRGERFKYPQPLYGKPNDILAETSFDKTFSDAYPPSDEIQTPVYNPNKSYKGKYYKKGDKGSKKDIYFSDENTSSYEKPQRIRSKHKLRKEQVEWCTENINGPESVPFDFQNNFKLFNKEKDFAEFKEQDSIPFQERLVGHNLKSPNRRSNQRFQQPTQYLRNNENVLDGYEIKEPRKISISKNNLAKTNEINLSVRDKFYLKTERGITCPKVDWRALLKVKRLAIVESRCSEEQFYENAGRTIALMTLKALEIRRNSVQKPNTLPAIIILAGDNETGAYSFSASRHLSNRGYQVYLLSVSDNSRAFKYYHSLTCAGVKIIDSLEEINESSLQNVGLIIDSLLGVDKDLSSLSDNSLLFKTINLIKWANNSDKPILSIGVPSGLTEKQGANFNPELCDWIQPWWTLCLGAPTSVLSNKDSVGEVYLGDIGIPSTLWKQIGIDWEVPYDSNFIIRLDF